MDIALTECLYLHMYIDHACTDAPFFLPQAKPTDVRLEYAGLMKKRVLKPAGVFVFAVFGSYLLGLYGFGAIYAVFALLALMSVERLLFR